MKRIQMPSSYAVVTEEEKELLGGGGAFRDAWDSFTDHLRLNDFFFRGGLLSLSISFIPMLLFNVVRTGYRVAEKLYDSFVARTGRSDETLNALQNYTDAMRQKKGAKTL